MNHELWTMYYETRNTEFTPDVSSLAFLSGEIQSTKYYVRNYLRNMQNKPNSPNVQILLTSFIIMIYTIFISLTKVKNKPNSNPNKPNCRKAQMNVSSLITKDYRKKDDFTVRINKPNFVKGQNEQKIACRKIWPHSLNIKNLSFCWEFCLWLL